MATRSNTQITKSVIDRTSPHSEKDVVIWDREVAGFAVRIKPSGVKSFCIQYRNAKGRSRRLTLGQHGKLTVKQARAKAKRHFGDIAQGIDPAEKKATDHRALTVSQFADRYLSEYADIHKKPRSAGEDRRLVEKNIKPAIGANKIGELSAADVRKLHQSLRDTPTTGNRVIALLSKMCSLAMAWGERPDADNPCRDIKRYEENKREKFLSGDEMRRLAETLAEVEHEKSAPSQAVAAILLLIFTGCRKSEILTLRWRDIDFGRGCLFLPTSKTGQKTVYLNGPALRVLKGLPQPDDPGAYVIPAARGSGHLIGLQRIWHRIRTRAGLEGVRIHDLRHSFASAAISRGETLHMLGALLGHQQAQTTHRYAHVDVDPHRAAAERVGEHLLAMMGGEDADTVDVEKTP